MIPDLGQGMYKSNLKHPAKVHSKETIKGYRGHNKRTQWTARRGSLSKDGII